MLHFTVTSLQAEEKRKLHDFAHVAAMSCGFIDDFEASYVKELLILYPCLLRGYERRTSLRDVWNTYMQARRQIAGRFVDHAMKCEKA